MRLNRAKDAVRPKPPDQAEALASLLLSQLLMRTLPVVSVAGCGVGSAVMELLQHHLAALPAERTLLSAAFFLVNGHM